MKLVVTGAAGFIGANLVRAWVASGHEVHAVVRREPSTWRLTGVSCAIEQVDLAFAHEVGALLDRIQPDAVVSAAAHGGYSNQRDVDRMVSVNFRSVVQLVDWAALHDVPLLHLGSSSEYGLRDHAPSETDRIAPNSMYAITKAAGTHVVCDAVTQRRLQGIVFRLYSVYGAWEQPTRLLPTLAAWGALRRLPPTLAAPEVARDFIHVDDVAAAATGWINDPQAVSDPAIVNIGSGRQSTLADVVEIARESCGIVEEAVWGTMSNRSWDTSCWIADPSRARLLLGWVPRVSLPDGFRRLVDFVLDHPEHYPAPTSPGGP